MGGCSLSTIGLDSLAEYSVSLTHTHKQKERIDKLSSKNLAFDREITLHLILFCFLSVNLQSDAAALRGAHLYLSFQLSSFLLTRLLADTAALEN